MDNLNLIEVTIDSVRVSLMSPHRIVLLKDTRNERYLTIWIGSCESDAITAELQGQIPPRPLTHDLLKSLITTLGARVRYIVINDLREDVFFASLVLDVGGNKVEVDARPSDAIALAVRVRVPIYVSDSVMDRAAITPDQEVGTEPESPAAASEPPSEEKLNLFRDFVESIDFDEDDPDKDKS
ncbi:MAG TPA: bifunctional nuclease family protein [Aggregatilineales bacterium]|nr:bifunctional nuclease family protein [Aggregatilineales bacterium]